MCTKAPFYSDKPDTYAGTIIDNKSFRGIHFLEEDEKKE